MRTGAETGKPVRGLTTEAIDLLQRHPWPGNVRELQHAIERAVILSTTDVLQPSAFDGHGFGLTDATIAAGGVGGRPLPGGSSDTTSGMSGSPGSRETSIVDEHVVPLRSLNVAEAEQILIERALAVTGNNRTRAADLLGMSVRTLRKKLNTPTLDGSAGSGGGATARAPASSRAVQSRAPLR